MNPKNLTVAQLQSLINEENKKFNNALEKGLPEDELWDLRNYLQALRETLDRKLEEQQIKWSKKKSDYQ